jgi:EAL domain-containing protein (putative c-di-GMP-specific phosphodiesterase class I)
VGRLRALDCRYAQGYYFSRPLDAEAMTEYLDAPIGSSESPV